MDKSGPPPDDDDDQDYEEDEDVDEEMHLINEDKDEISNSNRFVKFIFI